MSLVAYSDSEDEDRLPTPPVKKRKVSRDGVNELPPLPTAFLDQYSSTVRTSTYDDPSLHGGRKRIMPHVQGSWPTHVYLEWHPGPPEFSLISEVVSASHNGVFKKGSLDSIARTTTSQHDTVKSLLENDLGVSQPLHISLSRPLVLKTEQKEAFLRRIEQATSESSLRAFDVQPKDLAWHPNESNTRWFLVLRMQKSSDLHTLLKICNGVAQEFQQPLLYETDTSSDRFHISVAWSLQPPKVAKSRTSSFTGGQPVDKDLGIPYELLGRLCGLGIGVSEVKVRIGQEVHPISLKASRRFSSKRQLSE